MHSKTFSGACTEFQLFICRHKQAVKHITSYETNLAKLLDSLDGEAIRYVAGCAVIGGKDGYYEAMTKLESRFGDRHNVTNALMSSTGSAGSKGPCERRQQHHIYLPATDGHVHILPH